MVMKLFLSVLVALAIAFGTAVNPSQAAPEIKLGLSSTLAPETCLEIAADNFKADIEKKSNGRIEIVRYPSGELFDPKSEVEAVVKGTVDMGMLHVAYVGPRSPALEFISSFGALGVWENNDHYWRFTDLPEIRQIAANEFETKLNAKLLAIVAYGNSLIGNRTRPIKTMEDFKGLKIRTAGKAQAVMYKTLGVIPSEISSNEIYMALQRGTIDGATSGPARFYFSKWYEVTQYLTQDNLFPYLSFWLAINLKKWNALSDPDKALLQETAREVELWTRDYAIKETEQVYEKLKGLVKELYFMPESETVRIRKVVEPVMHDLAIERMGQEQGGKVWGCLVKTRKAN